MSAFRKLRISEHIEGVKVTKAKRKQGVLLDFNILYAQRSTPEDINETFIKPFANQDPSFLSTLRQSNVYTDILPYVFQGTYAPISVIDSKPTKVVKTERVETLVTPEMEVTERTIHVEEASVPVVSRNSTGSGSTISYSQQRTLLWVLLAISFVAIILVISLVCHYKRHIYYHLMTL